MKIRLLLVLLVLGAFTLIGCQSNGNYPGPAEGYVPPEEEIFPTDTPRPEVAPGAAMYPEIENNSAINWFKAEAMILNGEVSEILVKADLSLQLSLKDGRLLTSAQPAADSVATTIEQCAEKCSATLVKAE